MIKNEIVERYGRSQNFNKSRFVTSREGEKVVVMEQGTKSRIRSRFLIGDVLLDRFAWVRLSGPNIRYII